jgi:DNA polymerase V
LYKIQYIIANISIKGTLIMYDIQSKTKRGGKREGAGRPKGISQYGEQTKPIRIPLSMINKVKRVINKKSDKIPLYGNAVPAGEPTELADYLEDMIDIGSYMAPNPDTTYMVKVIGSSMIKAGIFEGDLLIVDTSIEPKHQDIVVANVNNDMTVKRLYHQDGHIILMPENDAYDPILLQENEELVISGVVKFVIKKTS